jgi:hypothetical protein
VEVADEVPEPSADWELLTTTERYPECSKTITSTYLVNICLSLSVVTLLTVMILIVSYTSAQVQISMALSNLSFLLILCRWLTRFMEGSCFINFFSYL